MKFFSKKSLVALLVGIFAVPGLFAVPSTYAVGEYARCSTVAVVAHRGSVDATHTENTLRSTKLAVSYGASAVEGDLRLTKDGVWVYMHDQRVNRTTNGSGYVNQLTLAQIKRMRTNDGVLGGVPTLGAMTSYYQTQPTKRVELEIKVGGASDEALRRLSQRLIDTGLSTRTVIISFDGPVLQRFRAINPAIQTAKLSGSALSAADARQYGTTIMYDYHIVTPQLVNEMHAGGLTVQSYTVDTDADWRTVISSGVDAIVTDRTRESIKLCNAAQV